MKIAPVNDSKRAAAKTAQLKAQLRRMQVVVRDSQTALGIAQPEHECETLRPINVCKIVYGGQFKTLYVIDLIVPRVSFIAFTEVQKCGVAGDSAYMI